MVEPGLAGSFEALPAGLADGLSLAVVFVVGGVPIFLSRASGGLGQTGCGGGLVGLRVCTHLLHARMGVDV